MSKKRAVHGRPFFIAFFIAFVIAVLATNMRNTPGIVISLLCCFKVSLAAANPYLVLDSFSRSESVPITDAVDKWETPIKEGDNAFTYNWAEIGATYKGFGLGYLSRYDYELEYSHDTAEFYHLVNNKQPLTAGKQYHLHLVAKHTYSDGLRFSYHFQFNKQLQFTIGAAYLKGSRLTDGKLDGTATVLAGNDYDFTADVDYFYSKDVLFGRKVDSPDGTGYSIDTLVQWNLSPVLTAQLKIVDLIGRMYWNNAPNTTASAASDIKEYDQDGYVKYNPVLSGYETNQNFTQKLHPQVNLQFNYSIDSSIGLVGRIYNFEPGNFYQVGGEYAVNAGNRVKILYMLETSAVSLGYTGKYLDLEVTSDSFEIEKSYIFALKLNAHVDFN